MPTTIASCRSEPSRPRRWAGGTPAMYAGAIPTVGGCPLDYDPAMHTLDDLTRHAVAFRDERHWRPFHTPDALAANLCIEAAELLEVTHWRRDEALEAHLKSPDGREAFADELSDVLFSLLLLAHDQGLDLAAEFERKMRKNAEKYPPPRR